MTDRTEDAAAKTALKPCPFCGEADAFAERGTLSSAYVLCNRCGAKGPEACQEDDEEETPGEAAAIRHWNSRESRDAAARGREYGRERVAQWMLQYGFATGHGDSMENLLCELSWQVVELRETRNAAIKDAVAAERDRAAGIAQEESETIADDGYEGEVWVATRIRDRIRAGGNDDG